MKRLVSRSPIAVCMLCLGQSLWIYAEAKDLSWCSDTSITGTLGQSVYEGFNGMKHPIHFLDLDDPIRVLPSGGDCDYDKVVTDRIQLAGFFDKSQVGRPLRVTGRLLPQGAPADRYDVILFVPEQK